MLPGKVKGIGGAMDLVANPEKTKVVVTMVGLPLTWRIPLGEPLLHHLAGTRRQEGKSKDCARYVFILLHHNGSKV
jgi:hypothetical protein